MNFGPEDHEQDDDILELTDELPPEEESEGEEGQEGEAEPQGAAPVEDEPLELAIEGEDDGNETELVRRLRDQLRSVQGENAQLKKGSAPRQIDVGPKPTLWDTGIDGDEDKYDEAYSGWLERKRQSERQTTEQQDKQAETQREFDRLQSRHVARGAALRIPEFEKKNQLVIDTLGPEIAGLALVAADDSAKLVGALGSNPAALQKIADEPNPILKLKLILKMESRITVKKSPPPPEAGTIQRGTAPAKMVSSDKKLEQLERDAARSGDRSKVVAYKAALRAA